MGEREFNLGDPIAFFITWTSYGTWLSGDDRGSWHKGEPHSPNDLFRETAASRMKEDPFTLAQNERNAVERTIARHCAIRGWTLHAASARTNHVHVVVTATDYDGKTVMGQLKAWCSRQLKLINTTRKRFWTEGGSCRWINNEEDFENVVIYVNEMQEHKG